MNYILNEALVAEGRDDEPQEYNVKALKDIACVPINGKVEKRQCRA